MAKKDTDVIENIGTSIMDDVNIDMTLENTVRPHFFYPSIICGYCEHCGTTKYVGGEVRKHVDKQGEIHHELVGGHWEVINATQCPHYKPIYDKGQYIRCAYCGEKFTGTKNNIGQFMEILATRLVLVMAFEDQPKRLIMYCNSFECKEKHIKRMTNS